MTQTCTNTAGLIKTSLKVEWINAPFVFREKKEKVRRRLPVVLPAETSKGAYYSYYDYIYVLCFLLNVL